MGMEWTEFITPVLNWTAVWMVIGFIVTTVFWVLLPVKLSNNYSKLTWEQKLDWNARSASVIHSLVSAYYATKALLYYTSVTDIHLWNKESVVPLEISTGFFLNDFLLLTILIRHYGIKQYCTFFAHHAVSISAFGLCMYYQEMIWFANFRLISELSTPFLNIRWYLQQLDLRTSAFYNANRLTFFAVFTSCRIITIPLYWMVVHNNAHDIANIPKEMIFILFVSGVVLDTLNTYWFYLMIKVLLQSTSNLSIKPLMEKKKVEFKQASQEFHEKMMLIKNKNREKLSAMRHSVTNSMIDIRTRINTGLRLRRQ